MNVLQKLRNAVRERSKFFHPHGTETVPIAYRYMELAGEAGEVCNAGKKLMRHEMGSAGGSPDQTNLREELGDVIICCELIAQHYGIDLWDAVVEKYNKTSEKMDFPIKLDEEGNIVKPKDRRKALVHDENGKLIGAQV